MDTYFTDRVNDFVETFFGSKGLERESHWFRAEHQARGAAHDDGCLTLKDDPRITELSQKVIEGRKAEHKLLMLKELQAQRIDYEFEDPMETEHDERIPVEFIKKTSGQRMFNTIDTGTNGRTRVNYSRGQKCS